MFELLLVALFTSFFLAMLDALVDFLSVFISAVAINATLSLALSSVGNVLVDTQTVKGFIIKTVAGAFLGKAFLAATERLTTYRRVNISSARQ